MIYEARHEPCGTLVEDSLPDDYPTEEGVGLWCPSCRESFWHVAAPRHPERPAPPESNGGTRTFVAPAIPKRRKWPWIAAAAAVVATAAVVALSSGGTDPPPPATREPEPTRTPAPTPEPRPSRPTDAVRIDVPANWSVRRGRLRVVARAPGGALVRVSAAPRRDRSLRELGRDTRAALRPPGDPPLRRVRVGARRALRVSARGREVTALVIGRRRWIISRGLADGPAARRVSRSILID